MENIRFVVKLADTPIEARVLHESTRQFLREYLTEEAAAFFVAVTEENIAYERQKADPKYHFTDAYLETLSTGRFRRDFWIMIRFYSTAPQLR